MTATLQQTVSPEVKHLLPAVLIDYLWSLANAQDALSGHAFILTRQVLGGKELQEIRHVSGNGYRSSGRVFGFDPVNATVLITLSDGEMRMETAGLMEAAGLAPAGI